MERRVVLQGKNTAEKLVHLERILASYQNRLSKTIVGVIPPVPIMTHCDVPVEGTIAELLIPISGVIDQAYIRIGLYEHREAKITASVISGPDTISTEFTCNKLAHVFDVGWNIQAGDLIRVEGKEVADIHIALAIQPNLSRAVKEKHILEGLLHLIEQGERNGTEL